MSKVRTPRLLAEERRREIVQVLDEQGRITVDEVVSRFGVSAVTARGDLDHLSDSGFLVRSHGGGVRPLAAHPEHPLRVREGIESEKKQRIADAAADLIRPLQTVVLCTGSTSVALARTIKRRQLEGLRVITYAVNVANVLMDAANIELILLGGVVRQDSCATLGPQAEHMMQSLHADHCFLPTVGLDLRAGLTTLDISEAQLNRTIIQQSSEVTVLADSTKFGVRSLSVVADLRSISRIVTNADAPSGTVADLRLRGLEVVLV
jgi:DeoR family transcriptional regulator, aga operon transcriptional repressor